MAKKLEMQELKKGMYLWDTRYNHCIELYGIPYKIERGYGFHQGEQWAITGFLYGKPKKNRNKKIILDNTLQWYIRVTNPDAARILYG